MHVVSLYSVSEVFEESTFRNLFNKPSILGQNDQFRFVQGKNVEFDMALRALREAVEQPKAETILFIDIKTASNSVNSNLAPRNSGNLSLIVECVEQSPAITFRVFCF